VEQHKNEPVSLDFIRGLAHFIWQLQNQGVTLGSHLRLCAVNEADRDNYLSPATIQFAGNLLRSAPSSAWALLGGSTAPTLKPVSLSSEEPLLLFSDVLLVIQQAAAGNRIFVGDSRCNRCKSTNAGHHFRNCAQSYYQGHILNFGACNECALNGNSARCTFYSESFRRCSTLSNC
jgi:hypothetical protein